jgi:glycosyl transferase family 25
LCLAASCLISGSVHNTSPNPADLYKYIVSNFSIPVQKYGNSLWILDLTAASRRAYRHIVLSVSSIQYPASLTIFVAMQEYFQPINEYYDKIYVLTLPRLTDRIAYINKTLKGLDFEFFFGVDKQNTSLERLKRDGIYSTEAYRQFYKKPAEIPLGMLCCSLGHLQIYENIVQNGYHKTLILEDDAMPVEESLAYFPQIIGELPSDWELLYLGYEKNETNGIKEKIKKLVYTLFPFHSQLKMTPQLYSHYYPVNISAHISKAGFHDCTHAYSVTLEGAKKLLQLKNPVRFHPDNLLSYMNGTGQLKSYIAKPKLFNQLTAFVNQMSSLTSD